MDENAKLKRVLGGALLAARERAGLTQAEVASLVGIASAVYGRIERGQMLPSVPTLCRICMALSISSDVLLALGPEERAVAATSTGPEESPELRRLENQMRSLSPAALRTLLAVVAAVAR